ncbi:sensor histidine kinase [Dyadobacter crusticola]|uniref:sensor histidine kinase n=1 Tax=Dyadobacter crusticola TaxID=292407 RepID=UPI0004E0DA95|nr:PAS domain-containing sensor histidine kinase [Dyadobacter crusticola]
MNQPIEQDPEGPFGLLDIQDYHTLLTSFAQAVWETDPEGTIVCDSPSWRTYTGQTRLELLTKGWLAAVHPLYKDAATRAWEQALNDGIAINAEFRLQNPQGGWRWTNLRATQVLNADGSVKKWLGLNIDITEKKQAEDSLSHSEERTRLAVDAADMATWEWDLVTDQVYWNEQQFTLMGVPPQNEPMLAEVFLDRLHPDDAEFVKMQLDKMVRERSLYNAEFRIIRDNGVVRWMSGHGRVTAERDGEPVQACGVMFDITDRKQAEESLRRTDRRKDEFLAMLSHELRNPMAVIRSGIQVLNLVGSDQEIVRSTVTMMNRQTEHLVRLLDDLLNLSRITNGKIELRKEQVDLVELVRLAADQAGQFYRDQNRLLEINLPPYPIYLGGDSTRLTQVVTNLLTNGARYTDENGLVCLSLKKEGDVAVLQVRDNGIGLEYNYLSAIFELFVQADNSPARARGGLGIGLTLVKRLVEMHGGRVEVWSEGLGSGSTFTVYLPTLAENQNGQAL